MRLQNTLKNSVEFSGVGLHSGHNTRICLKPAPEDTGLVFVYKNGQVNEFIPYNTEHVTDTVNNISVSNGKAVVKTVEHLVAALYALHIDNCLIECGSSEIPIMDGSSSLFVEELLKVGIVQQNKNREEFRVIQPVWATQDDKFLVGLPYDGFKLSYTISFPNSPIGTQAFQTEMNPEVFMNHISGARTFGFIEDLENLRKSGLSLGVNYENVHVFSRKENKALNNSRYNDEPVRHKVLDLIGALALFNFDIKGFLISFKGGHTLDVLFAKKIIQVLSGEKRLRSEAPYRSDTSYYYHVADMLNLDKIPS